jgi:hypothetical protein
MTTHIAQGPVDVGVRARFEAWKRSSFTAGLGLGRKTEPGYTDEYDSPFTQQQWLAWKAAEEAERARMCAAIKAADDKASEDDYMLDSNDCIDVILGRWKTDP